MRVIAGKLAGRVFSPPLKKSDARAITDKAKEAVYNILFNYIDFEGVYALDLFSGFGNHSYEIISRGGIEVIAVEKNHRNVEFIKETTEKFDIADAVRVIQTDVYSFLETTEMSFDLIMADPPYEDRRLPQIPDLIFQRETLLKPGGLFVLEHSRLHNFEYLERCIDTRSYGQAHFSFFR